MLPSAPAPVSASRLLVVEDDEQLRDLIVQVAAQAGFSSEIAVHGREASKRIAGERFDAMVTDIYMPEIDGIELIRQARALHPGMPIIAISGGGDAVFSPLRVASLLGAAHVLPKPFAIARLVHLLQAARVAAV
jgi:DNA-binding response OmpR family regulator